MEFDLVDNNIIQGQSIDLLIQLFLFVVLLLYTGFALLVNKQVRILNKSIQTTRSPNLNKTAKVHLLASIVLLLLVGLIIVF